MGHGTEPLLCPECEARRMDNECRAWRKREDEREARKTEQTSVRVIRSKPFIQTPEPELPDLEF